MKKFFEEYGFTILASIVVILLIIMVGPIGSLIQSNISHVVESFSNKVYERLVANDSLQPKTVIVIDNKEYIIIEKIDGSLYKVLAPSYIKTHYDKDNKTNYDESEISKILDNEYYNSLPDEIKNSIVEQIITQKYYDKESLTENNLSYFNLGKGGYWNFEELISTEKELKNTHKVFIPSIDEISKIINVNNYKEVAKFTNADTDKAEYYWLRDVRLNLDDKNNRIERLFNVNCWCKSLSTAGANYAINSSEGKITVRPVMVLDLSKVNYTVK